MNTETANKQRKKLSSLSKTVIVISSSVALLLALVLCSCTQVQQEEIDNELISKVERCIPSSEFVGITDSTKKYPVYSFKTADGVTFTANRVSSGKVYITYYHHVFETHSDEIMSFVPDGVSAKINYFGISVYIDSADYLPAAAEFCAKVESMFNLETNKDSKVIIASVYFDPYVFCKDCEQYIPLGYLASIILPEEHRIGYGGMYNWLKKSYELMVEQGQHFVAS